MEFRVKGVIIGFAIAAPVGPVGVLCIRHALVRGWLKGVLSGLGAATADAIYGLIAVSGLTIISQYLLDNQTWLTIFGGVPVLSGDTDFSGSTTGYGPISRRVRYSGNRATYLPDNAVPDPD